ncbi:type II toxin-antitoxin system VapC family toxin [Glaciecola sp. MH2013]|uniref:type II toxin-antitoxin system VapC family toxin n=1 Tax=Glaciecola sp. MH2013 TaxID=2785524 RepID=UPI0018A012B4|nr:type II toxin-antitoxin system VapC family toxin [Glaciecola sp. MH2013]MBF7073630.1 type II toxin-antitoxin system VapC family toxin [Glaciecola sp. MH2013]
MFLLDTNVVSALRKPSEADKNLVAWASSQQVFNLYVSSISIMELKFAILEKRKTDPKAGELLNEWLQTRVLEGFKGRVVAFDAEMAEYCAALHVPNPKSERDAMIAATCLVNNMTLVTKTPADFKHIKIPTINPWEAISN